MVDDRHITDLRQSGKGLGLLGLFVGAAAGGAFFAIQNAWPLAAAQPSIALAANMAVGAFAIALLFLIERKDLFRPIPIAGLIAIAVGAPTLWLARTVEANPGAVEFPLLFWLAAGAPLVGYLLIVLSKAALTNGFPPRYTDIFVTGLTVPIVVAGVLLIAALGQVFIFSGGELISASGSALAGKLAQANWIAVPAASAITGLAIAMMRGQQALLGSLRYVLLMSSRFLAPVAAAISIAFFIFLALQGPSILTGSGAAADLAHPGAMLLAPALIGLLIFNGVYQNGEGAPPPMWLRISSALALVGVAAFAALALFAVWSRISAFGLTPVRLVSIAASGFTALYAGVCILGLVTEANWRSTKWMPTMAPANTAAAFIAVIMVISISSPIANPWALSAKSQERLLKTAAVPIEEFDFKYLVTALGSWGEKAGDRVATSDHPDALFIRKRIDWARAQATADYYANAPESELADADLDASSEDTPGEVFTLPMNPGLSAESDSSTDESDDPAE